MNRFFMTCGAALLLAACVVMLPYEASGQKKKAPPKKTEQVTDEPAPAPPQAPPAMQSKAGGGLRDVLAKHKGEKTNLGILTRVEGDCFVIDEEGVTTYYSFNAINCIRIVMPSEEEEEGPKVEIVLMR